MSVWYENRNLQCIFAGQVRNQIRQLPTINETPKESHSLVEECVS